MLKVERLTKTYPTAGGALTVLREVSFDLERGASLAIVGPSGSGKTTLLGLCAGLDDATDGTVALAGELLAGLDEDARALVRNAHVGFVFQNFQLIPTLTARITSRNTAAAPIPPTHSPCCVCVRPPRPAATWP